MLTDASIRSCASAWDFTMFELWILALGGGAVAVIVAVTVLFSVLLAAILDPAIRIEEDE